MRGRIRLSGGFLTAALAFAVLLAGCEGGAAQETDQNGLAVQRDGQVMLYIVDSFDKGYYDIDELKKMAQEEADAYNGRGRSAGEEQVLVEEVSRVGRDADAVRVVYRFRDAAAYSGFQGEMFYYETLEQAIASRHVFSGAVLFCEEGTVTLDEKNKARWKGRHVVVTDAKTRIRLPHDVLYYSEGIRLLGDRVADTSECGDTAVILLKK